MKSIISPWAETFERFSRSIRSCGLIVTPYITAPALNQLESYLDGDNPPRIELLTNLAVESLFQGSIDSGAIARFSRRILTVVRHLPGLHAKDYVADEHSAIITSGNLTQSSLYHNYEYGIEVTERETVREIARDLRDYGSLGVEVSSAELEKLAEISVSLREKHSDTLRSARASVRKEFETHWERAHETLRQLRARPGETTNSIFSRTILYLLAKGALTTKEIHPLVQGIHPDLCDDSIERVINEVHFGMRWKHMVRNAQQTVKSRGLVEFANGKWRLVN